MSYATAGHYPSRIVMTHDSRVAETSRSISENSAISDRASPIGGPPPSLADKPGQFSPPPFSQDSRLSVLIAEDNFANQLIAKTLLIRAGYTVTTANDGAQAVAASEAQPFDLILMDIEMPELSGIEVTEHIRKSGGPNQNVLIIALTAHGSSSRRHAYHESGINHVLPKPFKIAQLENLLGRKAAEAKQSVNAATTEKDILIDEKTLAPLLDAAGADGLATILKSFWSSAYALHDDMQKAHEALDRDRLQKSAHALKGASLNIGLPAIAQQAVRLQNAKTEDAPQLLSTLDDLLEKSRKALNLRIGRST